MGVYSDLEIKAALLTGRIVIHPLIEEHIRGSSVDVTLGEWFFRVGNTSLDSYNPYDRENIASYFGEPLRAVPHGEWAESVGRLSFRGIAEDHPIIVLGPGERILAHTHEFVGIRPPGTTEMRARSSWGRNGVAACFDAGWGDPGYINRWTMEIFNLNRHSVPLPVGERIAQIVFHQTGRVERSYGDGGKYQSGSDLASIIREWTPWQMVPKAHVDVRRLPLPTTLPPESREQILARIRAELNLG